jgi:hypothetical protein
MNKFFMHYGRAYRVLARIPDANVEASNAFMDANPGTGLLAIKDGMAIIVGMNNMGVPIQALNTTPLASTTTPKELA